MIEVTIIFSFLSLSFLSLSLALMNQYTMIANQFPLPPINTTPATSVGTSTDTATTPTTTATEDTNATASGTTVENPKPNTEEPKITDEADHGAGPSTSKAANSIESVDQVDSTVTIKDIGQTDPSEMDESMSEVRRRRLQRFEAKGVDS